MGKAIAFACACIFLNTTIQGQVQDLYFSQWNIEDGLSHPIVRNLAQDQHGYLWVATENGLNRFDGNTFRSYFHSPRDSNSLSHNKLFGLAIDRDNVVWVGSERGLNSFDQNLNTWTRYQFDKSQDNSLSDNYVRDVYVDSKNRIWVGTRNGLNLFDSLSDSFTRLLDDRVFENAEDHSRYSFNRINTIFEDRKGRIWVGSDGGGSKIYNEERSFQPFYVKNELSGKSRIIRKIFQDIDGDMWFGTDEGLAHYSEELEFLKFYEESNKPDGLTNQFVWSIQEVEKGKLWIGTYRGGINVLSKDQEQFIGQIGSENGLTSDLIWPIIADQAGGIWVGCDGPGGLNYYHSSLRKFDHYLKGAPDTKFSVDDILEITASELLVSTSQGLVNYQINSGEFNKIYEASSAHYLASSLINQGDNFLVVRGNEVFQFIKGRLVKLFTLKSFDGPFITSSYLEDGILWIGTLSQGLLKIDLISGEELLYFDKGNSSIYTDSRSIKDIEKGPSGKLWISSVRSGLFLLDPKTGDYEQFLYHGTELDEPTVTTITTGSDSVLWLGTLSNGVVKFNWRNGETQFLNQLSNSPKSEIAAILPEGDSIMWVSSKTGLFRFRLKDDVFHQFSEEDGLQGKIFNTEASIGKSGKFYFGGSNGINGFYPESIQMNTSGPLIRFENIFVNDSYIQPGDPLIPMGLGNQKKIELPHDKNYLNVTFSSIDFVHGENVKHFYRIGNQNWIELGLATEIRLPNMAAGKYELYVRAMNNDGHWGASSSMVIAITPPFWKTNTFQILIFVLIVVLFVMFYFVRLERISRQKKLLEIEVGERTREINVQKDQILSDKEVIQKQAEELLELDKAKSQFFANISHELRTPLTLVKGPLEFLTEEYQDELPHEALSLIQTAQKNGDSLLELVEEILDLTKLEAGKLDLVENPVMICELISETLEGYQYDFEQKKIKSEIKMTVSEDLCIYLDGRKFSKVLNNLLSNARKFTGENELVQVEVQKSGEMLTTTVTDTGRGIDPEDLPFVFDRFYQSRNDGKAEGGTGIGLALCKELIHLMSGEISVESTLGKGTSFKISVPLKKATVQTDSEPDIHQEELLKLVDEVVIKYNTFFELDAPSVLIVEDNHEMRKYVMSMFQSNFNLLEAVNGHGAIEILNNKRVDIIISDVMMPGMDGFELLSYLKSEEAFARLSIVMLTARAAEEDKLFALTKGVDDYLTKPFSKPELLARIKNILQNRISKGANETGKTDGSADGHFLEKVQRVIQDHLNDKLLTVSFLANEMSLSSRQFQRKMVEITGLSPAGFIREIKLQKAYRMLSNREKQTVSEVAREVGYEKVDYFSTQFISRYGKRPSSFI